MAAAVAKGVGRTEGCNRTDIACVIDLFANEHIPLQDIDGDRFSGEPTLRGYHWRGRDCDTKNSMIYPGRKSRNGFLDDTDHDCNGIFGVDQDSGKSYEELYCDETDRRGIAILGDSATAHFHVPPQWLTADGWAKDKVFSAASLALAEDELVNAGRESGMIGGGETDRSTPFRQ